MLDRRRLPGVWRESALFPDLRSPQTGGACASCGFYDSCRGGCMAAKFFTGLPLDGPDPECVQGYGEDPLAERPADRAHLPRRSRTTPGDGRWTMPLPARRADLDRPPSALRRGPAWPAAARPSSVTPAREELTHAQNAWFETVAEAQRRARKRLPSSVYGALSPAPSAAGPSPTTRRPSASSASPRTSPGHHAERDLATTVMGQSRSSLPVLISPTGVQAVHPDGEVAVARAAANRGVVMGLSSFASKPVEEVVAANPQTFFQMYWTGTRDSMVQRMDRARAAGRHGADRHPGLVVLERPRLGQPGDPREARPEDDGALRPRGAAPARGGCATYRAVRPAPRPHRPNLAPPGGAHPTFFGAYDEWMQTPPPTWEDVAWLREQWGGPVHAQGRDAGSTTPCGPSTPASTRDLGVQPRRQQPRQHPRHDPGAPAVADAVGDQIEVLLDGGVRRGSDVVKALALGARAVMIGRAYLWGLAANGQAGVENVLDILRGGIDSALLGLGRSSVHELSPDDLVIPPGFARTLGGTSAPAPVAG